MINYKKDKKKLIIYYIIIPFLIILTVTGSLIYHNYYKKKFKFKGLGEIYQKKNRQFKLFAERKLTLDNKGNPEKKDIKNLPSYKARFSTNLNDGAYLSISLDFRFENSEGVKEIREKWERISFASEIALSVYSGKELDNEGKNEVLIIIENQIRKRIRSKIEYIYIDKFELRK